MRLAKYLAHAGVASRRGAERLIAERRVTVGGTVVVDPALDVDDGSEVAVDGDPVGAEAHEYILLHKPAGVVSTSHDPGGRPTVTDLVPARGRVYPVGRLDVDSTGLILLTNDGELANLLTHPRYGVPRTYRVRVSPRAGHRFLRALLEGVDLDDGRAAADAARLVRRSGPRSRASTVEITIHEGRKRQVRRMCEAAGHRVLALERVRFGVLTAAGLRPGRWRRLTDGEVGRLRRAVRRGADAERVRRAVREG